MHKPHLRPLDTAATTRRRLLTGLLSSLALPGLVRAQPAAPRIVVIGGGWGGLAAARRLRQQQPDAEVLLIDANPAFTSLPLSNRWLVGLPPATLMQQDYTQIAARQGYRFLQARVTGIDPTQRHVHLGSIRLSYDWLIVAAGIEEDFSPWFGQDTATAEQMRQTSPSGFTGLTSLQALKTALARFTGGTLLMNLPPAPYRCPPAPYERAVLLADWLSRTQSSAHLVILDPNPPMPAFERVFRDTYRHMITYVPQAAIRQIDPGRQRISTEFDTVDYKQAILMPPQRAARLSQESGFCERDGWAKVNPDSLQWPDDERIFLIGDQVGRISPLFGAYPKTGQMAARQGHLAADHISARIQGHATPAELPDSTCQIIQRAMPLEMLRIDTRYRRRGDGLIQQQVTQRHNPQPDDDDLRWAMAMYGELGLG